MEDKRYVVISGGSGGLGRATARRFAAQGFGVFSLDVKKPSLPEENIIDITADLTDSASVERAATQVGAIADKISAVISLAGIYFMDSLTEVPEAELKRIFEINFFGVWRLNRAFLPLLRAGAGRVIIITSELAGSKALPFNGIYSLTKTALSHYTDSLRQELALLDVPVIEILPGAFDTGMVGASYASLDKMTANTRLYKTNTARFRQVMQTQSGAAKPPQLLAGTVFKAATVKHPRLRYKPNQNLLMKLYDALPRRVQLVLIGMLIKK